MIVCVTTEHRFYRTADGAVWTDGPFARPFWDRYLDVFDGVRVIARVRNVQERQLAWVRSDGDQVSFAAVTYYVGPVDYLRKWRLVRKSVCDAVGTGDAVILRVPSALAMILSRQLIRNRHPYAVEVVGDPFDAFAPGAIRHFLRPYLRWRLTRAMREQCKRAGVTTYVTAHALQRRYPAGDNACSFEFSDVQLDGQLAPIARTIARKSSWTLVTVGSLAHLYKAQDLQIDAIARCRHAGLDVRLVIVGDGQHRRELEQRAATLGIREAVNFAGQLSAGTPIRDVLDRADLFLLPSRQEGLPRALIEAMARGLPCIASNVGGIPELLLAEDLVVPDDVAGLATKIRDVLADSDRMRAMSERNLRRAHDFTEDVLREKRLAFYQCVHDRALIKPASESAYTRQLIAR